jgi:benzoyl-CoA reductase/2-hydroxyglutaryl-CoA dehydratase subunit BcrC/BadD/HgdB
VPDEIIAAFDMVPYRIQGNQSIAIDEADAYIEPTACPFARSCFNLALRGEYDLFSGRIRGTAQLRHFRANVPYLAAPQTLFF